MSKKGLFLRFFTIGLLLGLGWILYEDIRLQKAFEGRRWSVPAHVYAKPLELYEGASVSTHLLKEELEALGYRKRSIRALNQPGQYSILNTSTYVIWARKFTYPDGRDPSQKFTIRIQRGRVVSLKDTSGASLPLVRLDPQLIGSLYPDHQEDRIPLSIEQIPPLLQKAFVSIEDKEFYDHMGLSWRGILRAAKVIILSGGKEVQGGSTLTQQLVKNYFLTRDRTLIRKVREALLAVLLEIHYSKEEILQAYLNEVFIAQAGRASIHGVELGSQFLFGQSVSSLRPDQMALLAGMVKGPSFYDPRRFPERAKKRRNLVLDQMRRDGYIDRATYERSVQYPVKGLNDVRPNYHASKFPGYIKLVRRQLGDLYSEQVLEAGGLRIFTSLDTRVQREAQHALDEHLAKLVASKKVSGKIQGAVVVLSQGKNEVLAVVSGRHRAVGSFLRAVDAERPIGSLVKPFILARGLADHSFMLGTQFSNEAYEYRLPNGTSWTPKNYHANDTRKSLSVMDSLVFSSNLPTVRMGMQIGPDKVAGLMRQTGIDISDPVYPSFLLGSENLSPMEVAQAYLFFANQGRSAKPAVIRNVLSQSGEPLHRFPWSSDRILGRTPVWLTGQAMKQVVQSGTAKGMKWYWPNHPEVGGKTGTSNENRDAWFTGITGEYLATVWIGEDDNQPMKVTGSSGAMPIWARLMARLQATRWRQREPKDIEWHCGLPYQLTAQQLEERENTSSWMKWFRKPTTTFDAQENCQSEIRLKE